MGINNVVSFGEKLYMENLNFYLNEIIRLEAEYPDSWELIFRYFPESVKLSFKFLRNAAS